MLDVECKERFAQALRLTIDAGCLAAFARPLLELEQAAGPDGRCVVREGAAPLDFAVAVIGRDGAERFALALAYAGPVAGDAPPHRWTPADPVPATAGARAVQRRVVACATEVHHA